MFSSVVVAVLLATIVKWLVRILIVTVCCAGFLALSYLIAKTKKKISTGYYYVDDEGDVWIKY